MKKIKSLIGFIICVIILIFIRMKEEKLGFLEACISFSPTLALIILVGFVWAKISDKVNGWE